MMGAPTCWFRCRTCYSSVLVNISNSGFLVFQKFSSSMSKTSFYKPWSKVIVICLTASILKVIIPKLHQQYLVSITFSDRENDIIMFI